MSRHPSTRPTDDQHDDRPLILDELGDKLAQLHLLADSDEATDKVLAELGGSGRVERDMVRELAATAPLSHPERFLDAHLVAMRALEVLSRNGARPPSQLRAGPLTPVARYLAQQVIRYIVRQHQSQVVDAVRDLYSRRLGWMPADHPQRIELIRARRDVERAAPAYKKNAGGIPTFLVGGAAVSSVAQAAQSSVGAAKGRAGFTVAAVVTFVLLAAASWLILRGAAIARRRIRLTLDRPLAALWETVGWAGRPPQDSARPFAALAIVLTLVGWLLIPAAALLLFAVF